MELTSDALIALFTLTAMEIVLGIDNIIFISILVERLPTSHREQARKIGILLALVLRLGLVFSISWVMGLTKPLFEVFGREISGRDLILLGGGLFLIAKATFEMHHKIEGDPQADIKDTARKHATFASILVQILLLDIVFSLDSVITAVGMAQHVWIMVTAMMVSVGVMLVAAASIGRFVEKHPTIKILALSFLMLIGVMLVAEGWGGHVSKGYIYFAMTFSLVVELLNMRYRNKRVVG
jgi:predicted tellurium resistance membrane protein TerC